MKKMIILLLLSTVASCYVFSIEKYTQENSAIKTAKVNAISVKIINGGVFTITKTDSLQQLVSDLNNAQYAGHVERCTLGQDSSSMQRYGHYIKYKWQSVWKWIVGQILSFE